MEITNSKAYTSTEQSKILAQIIDKETADFCWGIDQKNSNDNVFVYNCTPYPLPWKDYTARDFYLPCWSLSALMDILPAGIKNYTLHIIKDNVIKGYFCSYRNKNNEVFVSTSGFNVIDAIFEMIMYLKENKLL